MDKKLLGAAFLSAGAGLTALSAPVVLKPPAPQVARPKLEERVSALEAELETCKNYDDSQHDELTELRSDLSDAVKRIEQLEDPDSDSPPND